jgi:hypothetical protein
MMLTPEQVTLGRRNFLKALAGGPPLLALGAAAALRGLHQSRRLLAADRRRTAMR